jgi:hypothetical protein
MPSPSPDPARSSASSARRLLSLGWWIRDRDGKVVLAQAPNAAVLVWLATVVVGWTGLVDDDRQEILTRVGQGALIVWGLDELLRGASPARRLLGVVVLAVMLVRVLG